MNELEVTGIQCNIQTSWCVRQRSVIEKAPGEWNKRRYKIILMSTIVEACPLQKEQFEIGCF